MVQVFIMKANKNNTVCFHPLVNRWFVEQIGRQTPIQEKARPQIASSRIKQDDLTIRSQPGIVKPADGLRSPKPNRALLPTNPDQVDSTYGQKESDLPSIRSRDLKVLREMVLNLLGRINSPKRSTSFHLPPSTKTVLTNLEKALTPAFLTDDIDIIAARIKGFVENSGIYFEKHLESVITSIESKQNPTTLAELAKHPMIRAVIAKDIKPNLLFLKQMLDSLSPDSQKRGLKLPAEMKELILQTLSNIDQQQLVALEKPSDPYPFQAFIHNLFFSDKNIDAKLKVVHSKKGREASKKQPRVSLLLEMDRLGMVRTDLWTVSRNLNITFFVQHESVKSAIDNKYRRMEKNLSSLFETVCVNVLVNKRKIDDFMLEDWRRPPKKQVDLNI